MPVFERKRQYCDAGNYNKLYQGNAAGDAQAGIADIVSVH